MYNNDDEKLDEAQTLSPYDTLRANILQPSQCLLFNSYTQAYKSDHKWTPIKMTNKLMFIWFHSHRDAL